MTFKEIYKLIFENIINLLDFLTLTTYNNSL